MIAIVNTGKNSSAFGLHEYELRINKSVVCTFEHKREDGLAMCLQRAAKAAEKSKWLKFAKLLEESK